MKKVKWTIGLLSLVGTICATATAVSFVNKTQYANAEEPQFAFSKTVYKVSDNEEKLLLVTAIQNYECVYEIGYEFTAENVTTYVAETTKYYDTLTTSKTETAEDIFGTQYAGAKLLVWEVQNVEGLGFTPYAKLAEKDGDKLVKPEVEVKTAGTARDNAKYVVTFDEDNGTTPTTVTYYNGEVPTYETTPTKTAETGYTYTFTGWNEALAPVTENVTYTAQYTKSANTYTINFKADETLVEAVEYTIENKGEKSAPAVPTKAGYTGAWGEYSFDTLEDQEVQANYTANTYTVTFKNGEETVGSFTYTAEDKEGKTAPAVPTKTGYTGAWGTYNLDTYEDQTVQVAFTPITYTITFKNGETTVGTVDFNAENGSTKTAPETPAKTGYTGAWGEYDFATLENQTVQVGYTANKYTITYNAGEGTCGATTQEVTYDQAFTLETATATKTYREFLGWTTADGKAFTAGTWTTADNVTLTAKYTDGISFEVATAKNYFSAGNGNVTGFEIVNTDATEGNSCLKVSIKASDYAINLSTDVLTAMFADPNVVAIDFDAKGGTATSNFRSRHSEYNPAKNLTEVSNWTYENNYTYSGLSTLWKTFEFKRDYMEGLVNFIIGGGLTNDYILIDNVRPVYSNLNGFGFECGFVDTYTVTNPTYKDAGHANGNPGSTQIFMAMGSSVKSVTLDNTIHSEGHSSLKVTKENNYAAFYFSTAIKNAIGVGGSISFDMYSSIAVNCNPAVKNIQDGMGNALGGDGYYHPAKKWVTYTLTYDRITSDGRFLQFAGSSGGDYYFDNIVIHPASENNGANTEVNEIEFTEETNEVMETITNVEYYSVEALKLTGAME